MAQLSFSHQQNIRPFNPFMDMAAVADLINESFAPYLDAPGRHSIEEMRRFGSVNWLVRLFWHSMPEWQSWLTGFVWIEAGQIIGNVTLQATDRHQRRWRIANVAVRPDQQRRGIARSLLERTLQEAHNRGGEWALLEVRATNQIAIHLYEELGFQRCGGEVTWNFDTHHLATFGEERWPVLQPLHARDWHALWELVHSAASSQTAWWQPFRPIAGQKLLDYDVGEWLRRRLGRGCVHTLGLWQDRYRLAAFLRLESNPKARQHKLWLIVHPDQEDAAYRRLVMVGLTLAKNAFAAPVTLQTSYDDQAFFYLLEDIGFQKVRDTVHMRCDLTREDVT